MALAGTGASPDHAPSRGGRVGGEGQRDAANLREDARIMA